MAKNNNSDKPKKEKFYFKPWQTTDTQRKKQSYVLMTVSVLKNQEFAKLTYTAKYLYICMVHTAGASEDGTFRFSRNLATDYGIQTTAFTRAVKELIECGFIEKIESWKNGQPNLYKFTPEKWQHIQVDAAEPAEKDKDGYFLRTDDEKGWKYS